jgi:hypothetical protein
LTFFAPFFAPFFDVFLSVFQLGSSFFPFLHIRIEKGKKTPVKNGGNHKKPEKKGRKRGGKREL